MSEITELMTEAGQAIDRRGDRIEAVLLTLATKADLAELEAKLEAKMATKDDLAKLEAKMATKDDLKALKTELVTVFHDTVANLAKVLAENNVSVVPKQSSS